MTLEARHIVLIFASFLTSISAVAQPPDQGGLFENDVSPVEAIVRHASTHSDGHAPFSFDASVYQTETRSLPIGVFDSGIGGLTVLEAILELDAFNNETLRPGSDGRPDFENDQFVDLGDQANMPYGNYAAAG